MKSFRTLILFALIGLAVADLAHAGDGPRAASSRCGSALDESGVVFGFEDELVGVWTDSLTSLFFETPPPKRVSSLDKLQHKAALWLLKKSVEHLDTSDVDLNHKLIRVSRGLAKNRVLQAFLGRAHRNVLVRSADQLPHVFASMHLMLRLATEAYPQFVKEFEVHRSTAPELYSESTFRTALMNFFAMRIFREVDSSTSPAGFSAVSTAALLHPVFDGAEDRGEIAPESLIKIGRAVSGQAVVAENRFESSIINSIRIIYRDFPPARHPRLKWIFESLLAAQRASEKQAAPEGLRARELFRLTALKGGLSTALFAYVTLGGLGDRQFEFFFRAGTLFQLLDDLHDAGDDRIGGIRTLFSDLEEVDSWTERIWGLISIWQDVDGRADNFSMRDFLSISLFIQGVAAIDRLPETSRTEFLAALSSGVLGAEDRQTDRRFAKLVAGLRLALAHVENPFFEEIDQFLWKGQRIEDTPSLSPSQVRTVRAFVDRLGRSGQSE